MSSDQSSVNAETIEQTKQQIRSLVSEISQLSKSDIGAEQYYAAFLQRVVSALAAVGGAVWLVEEGRRLQLSLETCIWSQWAMKRGTIYQSKFGQWLLKKTN